ncbi:MAG: hypothetical protein U0744_10250 [Gemmataceae bacterium]
MHFFSHCFLLSCCLGERCEPQLLGEAGDQFSGGLKETGEATKALRATSPSRWIEDPDDEVLAAFRAFLRHEVVEDGVRLLDRRLAGMSLRQIARDQAFSGLTAWALRRLVQRVREAARAFARRHGDEEFLAAIERRTAG